MTAFSFRDFFRRFQLEYLLNVLKAAFRRFPLTCLCCLAATLLGILSAHEVKLFSDETLARLSLFISYGMAGFLGAALFAESRKLPQDRQIAMNLLLAVVLAGFAILPTYFTAAHVFFGAALALLLIVAPYLGLESSEDSFWYFNYSAFVGVVVAGISTLVLCGGLAAILGSVDYLFELSIPGRYYGDIWIIGCGFFGPLLFLSYVPRQFDFAPEECRMMPGVFFIANYVVLPLVLIMTWVLYAYFAKIVLKWELPRGGLAYMVTGFGAVGTMARLAVFPMRENGTKLLQQFYKYFYHLLPVPLALLGFGLYTRLAQYGITEERYAIAVSFLWLTATSLFALLRPQRMHLKYIPLLLAGLFLLAAVGPWGAVPVSTRSQLTQLEKALEKNGMLKNGVIVKPATSPNFKDRQELSSILDYLLEDQRRAAVLPLLAPFEKDIAAQDKDAPFTADCRRFTSCNSSPALSQRLMRAWGMAYVSRWAQSADEQREIFNLRLDKPELYNDIVKVAPYQYDAQVYADLYTGDWHRTPVSRAGGAAPLDITFAATRKGLFTISKPDGTQLTFNLTDIARKFHDAGIVVVPAARTGELSLSAETKGLAARLQITSMDIEVIGDAIEFDHVQATVLLTP